MFSMEIGELLAEVKMESISPLCGKDRPRLTHHSKIPIFRAREKFFVKIHGESEKWAKTNVKKLRL